MAILPTKTVDGILVKFNKTINELNALVEASNAKATTNRQKINELTVQNNTMLYEADRATEVIKKLEQLIS